MHGARVLTSLAVLQICTACVRPAPVTAEEAEAFGVELARALDLCEEAPLAELFDVGSVVRTSVSLSNVPWRERWAVTRGMRSKLSPTRLCESPSRPRFKLLRVRGSGADTRALIRMISQDGVNYHEYDLARTRSGVVRARDVYVYLTGERISRSLANSVDALYASANEGSALDETVTVLEEFQARMQSGDEAGAQALLERLPENVRNQKTMRLFEVGSTVDQSEELYRELIDRYLLDFPDDPSIDLVSIDGFFLRGDYDGALAAVERLSDRVGGDPYLVATMATLFFEKLDFAVARRMAAEAAAADGELELPWWVLMNVSLAEGDFDAALQPMRHLRDQFGADVRLSNLVQSKVFQSSIQWKVFASEVAPPSETTSFTEGR